MKSSQGKEGAKRGMTIISEFQIDKGLGESESDGEESRTKDNLKISPGSSSTSVDATSEPEVNVKMKRVPRRSNRARAPPNRLEHDHGSESGVDLASMIMLMKINNDQGTVEDALSRDDWKE